MMKLLKFWIFPLIFWFQGFEASNDSEGCQLRYVIVVDGGSSGTRLNVFIFDDHRKYPRVNKTFTFKSKVALSSFSSYREDWSLMRVMLKNLTDQALTVIPQNCVNETPFYLQVTAGIRQIERHMGSRILNNIKNILLKSEFYFKSHFVDVLSSSDEGRLAWISINFMLGNFYKKDDEDQSTIGVLDLGGGSTQIAFATENRDLMKKSNKVRVLGQDYFIYSQGYDYMGINEARLKYFNVNHCFQLECKSQIVKSQCLHPEVATEYRFGNRTIVIGGEIIRNGKRFCHCFGKALNFTKTVQQIRKYFGTQKFVAFSAYFFILNNAGKIFNKNSDGLYEANIRDIILRTMEICKSPQVNRKSNLFAHFLCMDLSYIVALLHNGYGFEWYDELIISLKIKGVNLSWALGYAISNF